MLAIYIASKATKDTKKTADVILVLGAKSYHGNSYNPCLVSRVDHAVELYKEKYAPQILFSGGTDREDGANEAEVMKKIAIMTGAAAKDILLEKESTSTYENFLNSQKVLKLQHLNSVIIVTEPFHSARASLVAKKLDINFTISPVQNSECWNKGKYLSRYFLKEPFAVIAYWLEKKL